MRDVSIFQSKIVVKSNSYGVGVTAKPDFISGYKSYSVRTKPWALCGFLILFSFNAKYRFYHLVY